MILGCCCENTCGPTTVPEYENTTQVVNYSTDPEAPALIDPYARLWGTMIEGGCFAATCGGEGEEVCRTMGFDGSTDIEAGITPGGSVTYDLNGYAATGDNVVIANPCYGWKGVAARAVWVGRHGFINSGVTCCDTGGQEQSKYTTLTIESSAHYDRSITNYDCSGAVVSVLTTTYDLEMTQTASVDNYGNLTRTGSIVFNFLETLTGASDVSIVDSCDLTLATGARVAEASLNFGTMSLHPGDLPLDAECGIISVGGASGTSYFENDVPFNQGTLTELNELDPPLFTLPEEISAGLPCVVGTTVEVEIEPDNEGAVFDLTDSVLSLTYNAGATESQYECCSGSTTLTALRVAHISYSKTMTLSGGRAFSDVRSDAETMLAEWDLKDDGEYPWRTDAKTWLVPYLTRDAVATVPTVAWGVDGSCEFTQVTGYTGAVRGAPLPVGYGRHFDFRHINWGASGNLDGSVCTACELTMGLISPSELPATATQWTDKVTGANFHGPGGWMSTQVTGQYGTTGISADSALTMYKWAETIEEWPSLNLSRECGRDRYLYDETDTVCVTSFVAPDLTLTDAPETPFVVSDLVVLDDGGVYPIATVTSDTVYTVGALLYECLIPCDGAAKLRYPAARAICGQLAVTAVQTSPGVVTITVPRKHWLKRGGSSFDTVDFTGVAGLGTGLTATVVDDTSFTVSGTLGSYAGGGYVSSTGSLPTWDTTCPRHTYITREWDDKFREYDAGTDPEGYDLTETEHSYTYNASRPYVVTISPNAGDTPLRGVRFDFGSLAADHCFGSTWHMDVVQAYRDPYWQADHVPCGHSGEWAIASAPCAEDANHYPYPPLVEAMLTLPSGAPSFSTEHPTGYPDGESGIPGPVGHPNCDVEPYAIGTVHAIRAAWEACDDWREKVNDNC